MKKITNLTEMITLMGALGIIAEAFSRVGAQGVNGELAKTAITAWEEFGKQGLGSLVTGSSENFTNEEILGTAIGIVQNALNAE